MQLTHTGPNPTKELNMSYYMLNPIDQHHKTLCHDLTNIITESLSQEQTSSSAANINNLNSSSGDINNRTTDTDIFIIESMQSQHQQQQQQEQDHQYCHLDRNFGSVNMHNNDSNIAVQDADGYYYGDYDDFYEPFDSLLNELLYRQKISAIWNMPYLNNNFQAYITPQSRYNLAKWLMFVGQDTRLDNGEVLLALAFTDQTLQQFRLRNDTELYLLGSVCLVITTRLLNAPLDHQPATSIAGDLERYMCNAMQIDQNTMDQLTASIIQHTINCDLKSIVIPFYFLDLLINRLRVCRKHRRSYRTDTDFMLSAQKFINHAAMVPDFNSYSPSIVAAACIIASLIENGYNECMVDASIATLCQAINVSEDSMMSCYNQLNNTMSCIHMYETDTAAGLTLPPVISTPTTTTITESTTTPPTNNVVDNTNFDQSDAVVPISNFLLQVESDDDYDDFINFESTDDFNFD